MRGSKLKRKDDMEKLTFSQLTDYLRNNPEGEGVVVFKNGPWWKQEYPEKSRSYKVTANNNYFKSGMISNALWGDCLDGSEDIRLDWYLGEWKIDYCYITK